ncbi:fungal hydrophobin-domain-containing protein [Delphinella strobiligena]|nr:fungal hydrophobin-domain-containing protein [Delphinella strobiligena]
MQFQIALLALATLAVATPAPVEGNTDSLAPRHVVELCSSNYSPMCCETDVLGVADLDCSSVDNSVTTTSAFKSTCAKSGKSAKCCVTALLGTTGLICESV